MSNKNISLLKMVSNVGVVKVADRAFPSLLIQGDTFFNIIDSINIALTAMENSSYIETKETLCFLKEDLERVMSLYEGVCFEQMGKLPYVRQTPSD